jgi:hypothetical protein
VTTREGESNTLSLFLLVSLPPRGTAAAPLERHAVLIHLSVVARAHRNQTSTMGKKGGATPVVDKSKASEANLNVIKRIDPDVEEVSQSTDTAGGCARAPHRGKGNTSSPSPPLAAARRVVARSRTP